MQGVGKGQVGRSSNNRRNDEYNGVLMRKGPWMAEEDEILLEYVRKHGPRDWSSIRSKGLLPRTGKSCRLRWVNKLKPDLKTGCKFSPEEERTVITLQETYGNKWARISTFLPGRTDNDVKNFWSTRQKRLARILQTPLSLKSNKNHGKVPVSAEPPRFEAACMDLVPFGEESCTGQCNHTAYIENRSITMMNQFLAHSQVPTLPLLEPPLNWEPPQLHFDQLLNVELDFPAMLETPDLVPGFGDDILQVNTTSMMHVIPEALPFFGKRSVKNEEHLGTTDSFFDDFTSDMFDYLEQPLPPSFSMAW